VVQSVLVLGSLSSFVLHGLLLHLFLVNLLVLLNGIRREAALNEVFEIVNCFLNVILLLQRISVLRRGGFRGVERRSLGVVFRVVGWRLRLLQSCLA
jgi:hypothetical protein